MNNEKSAGSTLRTARTLLEMSLLTLILLCSCNPRRTGPETVSNQTSDPKRRGEEIAAEFRKRDEAPYRNATLRLTITSAAEPAKVYEMRVWRKQTPRETLTLTHVVKPETEKDLASLSIQRPEQPTVSVAYGQSTDRFYESDSNRQTFGGLTAHELLGEWDKYDFRFISEKETGGGKAFEVEAVLKRNLTSPIPRMTVLFLADNYLPAKLHMYSARGEEIRTVQVQEYRTVEGRPSPWRIEIENRLRGSKVLVEAIELSFPAKMDDTIFTRENLKRLVSK